MDTQVGSSSGRRWKVLGVLGIAQLMVVLDAAIMNIALPSAQADLHFASSDRQWVVTAYALTFGSLLLLGGRLSDLLGRRRTLLWGLAGFALASAVGGVAQSFGMLVAARAGQGAFGAVLAPSVLSLLTTTFTDPAERNKAFGVFAAVAGSGASVGLILGGLLTQYLSWRYGMYINLVFALVSIAGGLSLIPGETEARRSALDLPGAALASAAVFSLVYGFSHAQTTSWSGPLTVSALAASPVLFAVFIARQRRAAHPLLPLRIVEDRNRAGSLAAIVVVGGAIFALLLFVTYYLQLDRGYSPLKTGLAFLPMTVGVMGAATMANLKLRNIVEARSIVVAGLLLGGLSMLELARLGIHTDYLTGILPATLTAGIGMGLVMSTAMNTATAGVAPGDAGIASATVNATQQIGGSLGASLLSTVAASSARSYFHAGHPLGAAAVHGYRTGFLVTATIFAGGALLAGVLLDRHPATAVPTSALAA